MDAVSVIIPCYNHAHYLAEAIESVLAQTLPPSEVIVVDDGSTDNTRQVAARYPVRYIWQENRGLSGARNTGIRAARGEALAFLDADDLWLPMFLETLVPMLESDPVLGAAYGGCQFADAMGRLLPQQTNGVVPPERVHETLVEGDFFPAHVVLTRKFVFDRVGLFDETLQASEDWEMWLRVSAQYPMAGTCEIVALYRMHGDNMTRDLERMHQSQLAVVHKHFGKAMGDPAAWPQDRQRAYAGVYLWRAMAHYRRGETSEGQQFVGRALLTSPGLARQLDAFYALGCADQALGYLGDTGNLNLERNAGNLLQALDALFGDPSIPNQLRSQRRAAYGTAYLALGMLAYASGRMKQARNSLALAVLNRPELAFDRRWATTFPKSIMGVQLRNIKRSLFNVRPIGD